MIDTNKLRDIPISKVAIALGFQLNGGAAKCRLPGHDDKNPSFSVRHKSNRFHCYACNRSGDTIELVRLMQGVGFKAACRWLGEQFAVSTKFSETSDQVRIVREPKRTVAPQAEDALNPSVINRKADPEVYGFVLAHSPLAASGREYLLTREFSPSTIQTFRVGQIGDSRKLLADLLKAFGEERVTRCGLMQKGRYGEYFPMKSGYLLFPFMDGGHVVYLQGRRLAESAGPRWLCPAGIRPPAFNLNVLSDGVTTVLVCEGVTDVMSAQELGMESIGLIGASASFDVQTLRRLIGRNVAVLGDADRAGEEFAKRTVKQLSAYGIMATTKVLPTGSSDLNEHLTQKRAKNHVSR